MQLFKRKPAETRVTHEPFTYTAGKAAIWVSANPNDPRFEVHLESEKDTVYLYGLDKEAARKEPVDALLVGRQINGAWNLVAPGMNGAPRWFPFVSGRCRIVWSKEKPKVWLQVDGVSVACFDFESQQCWCASGFPHPSPWTKNDKAWNADAQEGWLG